VVEEAARKPASMNKKIGWDGFVEELARTT
jgi:hypothetical protein